MGILIPFLYAGLGVYIVVNSDTYPWSIEHINNSTPRHFGKTVLATVTVFILLMSVGTMAWVKLARKRRTVAADETQREAHVLEDTSLEHSNVPNHLTTHESNGSLSSCTGRSII